MSTKYLDSTGLAYFWGKIKDYVDSHGGGGGEHVELTQAEYDALSSAEKNNGSVYFITDGEPTGTSLISFTPTLVNSFTVASWGGVHGYKMGKLCMLTFHGVQRATAVTSETQVVSIPYTITSEASVSMSNLGSETANLRAVRGTQRLVVNSVNANTTYFGQILFFVE